MNAVEPLLSVAICTWNRSRLLRRTLEDMVQLEVPSGVTWELLVVNNNCTDDTAQVVSSFAGRLPIRALVEPQQGLSHARNAAVAACRGTYLLWTDDDVRIDRRWLVSYLEAFAAHPDGAFFGGPIQPDFEQPPPEWLRRVWPRVATAYGERALGDVAFRFDGKKLTPFGANYALRADVQRRHLYRIDLGRRPRSMLSGEETAVVDALLAEGHEGWWVPGALVHHFVPARHLTTRYLRQYFVGLGQMLALTEPPVDGPRLWGRPRQLWHDVVEQEYDYWVARVRKPPEKWINNLIVSSMTRGRLISS